MTLLYVDGFDSGDYATRYHWWTGYAPQLGTKTRFGVGRSLGGIVTVVRDLPAPINKAIVGVGNYRTTGQNVGYDTIGFWSDAGAVQHIGVRYMENGALGLYRGNGNTAVQLAITAGGIAPFNVWHFIELSGTISDTGGTAVVHLNGAEVINYAGDTRNGGNSTQIDSISLTNGWLQGDFYLDDLYICDDTGPAPLNDFLGDVRVYTLQPNGPGFNTNLTPSAAPNWSCVDEQPYSATDYVYSSTVGARDTYAATNLPAGVTNVYGVQINTIAKKSDAGPRGVRNVVRVGSTDYIDATAQQMADSDNSYRSIRTVNPATGVSWTPGDVNAMEIGVEVA